MSRASLLAVVGLTIAGTLPAAAQNLVIFPNNRPAAESTEAFRAEALRSDAYNIEASRLALQKSNNRAVRDYAEQTIVNRQATTDALLPRGTSLSAAGTVVGDAGSGNLLTAPLSLATAPIVAVGNVLQGRPVFKRAIVDTNPATPGRRVTLDPVREQRLSRLQAAPNGRRFDALYTADQARAQGDGCSSTRPTRATATAPSAAPSRTRPSPCWAATPARPAAWPAATRTATRCSDRSRRGRTGPPARPRRLPVPAGRRG
jgi:predicted outer membrane protein